MRRGIFKKRGREIELDEIFMDSSNLPSFNTGRMEGKRELPLTERSMVAVGVVFLLIAVIFLGQLFRLQVLEGNAYASQSENNRLDKTLIFAERGVIYDRNDERLAWNEVDDEGVIDFARRSYTRRNGLGQLLGYVNYPKKDSSGFYFRTEYIGRGGVEETYSDAVAGENGERLIEVNAVGDIITEHVVHDPVAGESIHLSVDAELSEALYDHIATSSAQIGFRSGAGAIMDVRTGEIIALASYPSYDPSVLTNGENEELLDAYNSDDRLPFLNKIIAGVYTPGSIVKPFMALGALAENIIDPRKEIVSTGSLVVPNPYNPSAPSIFTDWRAHGAVDMRDALAVSSNIYFYHVGGGYGDQEGLGITKMNEHIRKFGFGTPTEVEIPGEVSGVVPNPEWKEEIFEDDWRLGDTYLTAIGQFGFQVTPIQALRAYAAIANGGTLLKPTFIKQEPNDVRIGRDLSLDPENLKIVQEGMRQGVTDGIARSLNRSDVHIAAKTGTAELGARKEFVNSWVAGYYPYEDPQYAFILLMERGASENLFGSAPILSQFFGWMAENKPQYLFSNLGAI